MQVFFLFGLFVIAFLLFDHSEFYRFCSVTHGSFWRKDYFRCLQAVGGNFCLCIHHLGRHYDAERTEVCQIHALSQFEGIAHDCTKADEGITHITCRKRGLTDDTVYYHFVCQMLLRYWLCIIHGLSLALADRLRL